MSKKGICKPLYRFKKLYLPISAKNVLNLPFYLCCKTAIIRVITIYGKENVENSLFCTFFSVHSMMTVEFL